MSCIGDILVRITGNSFCAGTVWRDGACISAAPYLRKFIRQEPTLERFLKFCKKQRWHVDQKIMD